MTYAQRYGCWYIGAMLVTLWIPPIASSQDAKTFLRQLQVQAARTKSIEIQYKQRMVSNRIIQNMPKTATAGAAITPAAFQAEEWVYRYCNGKYYIKRVHALPPTGEPRVQQKYFDGERMYDVSYLLSNGKPWKAVIIYPNFYQDEGDKQLFSFDLLEKLGFESPNRMSQHVTREGLELQMVSMLASGGQVVDYSESGNGMVSLAVKHRDRIYKATYQTEYGCCPLVYSITDTAGNMLSKTTASNFVAVDGDLWFPLSCEITEFEWRGMIQRQLKPVLEYQIAIERFRLVECDDSKFVPADVLTKPGIHIADGTRPSTAGSAIRLIQYKVPADPGKLDEILSRLDQEALAARRSTSWSPFALFLIALNIAFVAFLLVVLYRRRFLGRYA